MKTKYEMYVLEYFKLSVGQIAFVGEIIPNINKFIPNCKADLYVGQSKVRTINIIGEDRFSGGDHDSRLAKRSLRTDADIANELKDMGKENIKLIFEV